MASVIVTYRSHDNKTWCGPGASKRGRKVPPGELTGLSPRGGKRRAHFQRRILRFAQNDTNHGQSLLPGGGVGLGDDERAIRSRLRSEFLHATVIGLGEIEVAVLVHAHAMNAPQSA